MKDTLYRWIGVPFLRLGRMTERMLDHDNIMVGMAGIGIMVLVLGAILVGTVAALVAVFGSGNPCPEGTSPIREIAYYIYINGQNTPVYETVGCG